MPRSVTVVEAGSFVSTSRAARMADAGRVVCAGPDRQPLSTAAQALEARSRP